MLVALGAFLGRLIGELNDTRLLLSELNSTSSFHSFDLPRRKGLGLFNSNWADLLALPLH